MTHKGWRNRETWSLFVDADRDPRLHAARTRLLDGLDRPVTGDDVRAFVLAEMADAAAAVELDQIAAEWERERRFRKGLLGD